jgi:gamma-glutamyltranspeptidase/glutathione hydrolase
MRTARSLAPAVALATMCAVAVLPRTAPAAGQSPHGALPRVARSTRGIVVASSPIAADVGMRVLQHGGNAVDAAVATAFALSVVEFGAFGLGGRLQMIVRSPDGQVTGFDGTIQVPAGYVQRPTDDGIGYTTIGAPGAVAALGQAHKLHGSKPLAELLAPAIELADAGWVLTDREVRTIASSAEQLRRFDGSRRQFFRADGSAYAKGDRLRLPELAQTLRTLASKGFDEFYHGEIARRIGTDVEAHGGSLRATDLAAYEAKSARIVRGGYRGYELIGTDAPAAGSTVVEVLHILERFHLSDKPQADWGAIVAQALRLGFQDQYRDFGGPQKAAEMKVSKEWAATRAKQIQEPGQPPNGNREVFSGWADWGDTTHFSVADAQGGMVASTQTLGSGMGAKVVTPGLGFLYAATMGFPGAFASKPGQRATTSMSPFLVLKDGKPAFVLGAAGGMRIISSIVEVISRTIDHKMSFADAVAAPRVHPDPGSYIEPAGEEFAMEAGTPSAWSAADLTRLRHFGFKLVEQKSSFAIIHGIYRDPITGDLIGVADPRGDGAAAGLR